MSGSLRVAIVSGLVVLAASASSAQTIAMYGEYHETNGMLINIPQNPPSLPCIPPPLTAARLAAIPSHLTASGAKSFQHLDLRPTGINDARCHDREQHIGFTTSAKAVFKKPRVGVRGARNIAAAGMGVGLAVGDPFTIPPFAFQQRLGLQVGIILNNVTRELETSFVAAMPGIDRNGPNPGPISQGKGSYTIKTAAQRVPIPALTRMFSPMNWQNPGNGQNNGKVIGFAQRLAANTTHRNTQAFGNEKVRVRYVAGPRQFGGTMALLLDGRGRLLLAAAQFDGPVPPLFNPAAATQPIGDNDPGFRVRNAAGWDFTVPGIQLAGRIKGFDGHFNTPGGAPRVAPRCTQTADPLNLLPAGCNEINGFDTYMSGVAPLPPGGTVALLPKATSEKHMFALTTGTVSIVRVALRQPAFIHFSDTVTAMGYDTLGVSTMGGPQRNVGLVAGSYSIRTSTDTQINAQMLGVNLKFTPEPGATATLVGGLGLFGLMARRRRA